MAIAHAAAPRQAAPATAPPVSEPALRAGAPAAATARATVERAAHPVAGLASNGKPPYPPAALRRGEQGIVVVRVTVGPDGSAQAASVQQSSGHSLLDEAAIGKVLRDWRFVPASRDGAPVTGSALVTFSFELEN